MAVDESVDRGFPLGPTSTFTIGRVKSTVVVTVHGVIDVDEWALIDSLLRDIIDAQGNLDVLLDLWDVDHLDTGAMPLIVHAARQAHAHGGRLRLADRACRQRADLPS